MVTKAQLTIQWQNPGDILSFLLLIGGDVVQRAIAQLFGVYIQLCRNGPRLYLSPVAFSFGWVGYAITSLASVIGDRQLMPSEPDCPSKVINCSIGYGRMNRSWLLRRVLRDHELAVEENPGPEYADLTATKKMISLRIEIFEIQEDWNPRPSLGSRLADNHCAAWTIRRAIDPRQRLGHLSCHRERHGICSSNREPAAIASREVGRP